MRTVASILPTMSASDFYQFPNYSTCKKIYQTESHIHENCSLNIAYREHVRFLSVSELLYL